MFDVFLSYRSVDEPFGTEFVYDTLARRLGNERVFLDHVAIQPGAKYPERLNKALNEVRVLVVVIGPRWLSRDQTGTRLVDRENDWVRHELRIAMNRSITIIPVLLSGTPLPSSEELPLDIRRLAGCQAVEVRPGHARADLARLADSIAGATRRKRWLWRTAVAGLMLAFLTLTGGDYIQPEPAVHSIIGDVRTADPCDLIDARKFRRYGKTKLDKAYGNFNRCDLIVNPDNDARVDVEVQFVKLPLDDGAELMDPVGAINIMAWPEESSWCERALALPPGNGDVAVVVSVDFEGETPGATPLCEMADVAIGFAAGALDAAHVAGQQIHRRQSFPEESWAHRDACMLLDSDVLAAVIPSVDVTEPRVGYGNWSCRWSSTSEDIDAKLRFDQSAPLDASDGRPTKIGDMKAFVKEEAEGPESCTVRVVHAYPGQNQRSVNEILQITVDEDEDREHRACEMTLDLAEEAVSHL